MKKIRKKRSVEEYLAFLTVKYEVDPEEFLYALRLAEENEESRCGELLIRCRGKIKTKFVFLVKMDSEVIAQFRVDEEFLFNKSNRLKDFMDNDRIRRYVMRKYTTATANFIGDLRTGMQNVSLKAKILGVAEPRTVITRYGTHASFAKASLADETGTIELCLWNNQIGSVSTGDTVQIENARVSAFRGERQMILGRNGTVSVEIPEICS